MIFRKKQNFFISTDMVKNKRYFRSRNLNDETVTITSSKYCERVTFFTASDRIIFKF